MTATLELTRKPSVLMEFHRGTVDALVDRERVGSIELNGTFEMPVAPGRHTLKIRKGRYTSRELSFQATDGQVIRFNCSGGRVWPVLLASLVVPSLAFKLSRA